MLLCEDEVHLFYVEPERVRDQRLLAACRRVLSMAETARMARFRRECDRHLYLVSHAALRCVLSQYAPIHPGDWSFVTGPHGKPRLAGPRGAPLPAVNLSHTHSLVAVAVAAARDVGVDVECVDRPLSENLVERVLAERERRYLEGLGPPARAAGFFDFWTLKEAYLKARGEGLVWPLDRIEFEWTADRSARLRCGIESENPAEWRFWRITYGGHYRVAVAMRCPHEAVLRVFSAELAVAPPMANAPSAGELVLEPSILRCCGADAARPRVDA